jgi:hypothetical protein
MGGGGCAIRSLFEEGVARVEGLLLTFFVYACGFGKPLDGRTILVLCRQELQMLVGLTRAATVATFRKGETFIIRYSLSQAPRTHNYKRRIDGFQPCALRRVVDTPERGRLDATGRPDFGILQAQASDASHRNISVLSVLCVVIEIL